MATRRTKNGASQPITSPPTSTSTTTTTTTTHPAPPPSHSPYTPTSTETLLLSIYPLTLFLGAAFSHLSPTLRPPYNLSTYNVLKQSFQPQNLAPSYFAQKRNVFNVYFVKRGWFWCSLALLMFVALVARGRAAPHPDVRRRREADMDHTERRHERDQRIRRRWQALLRWTFATGAWVLVTQWCFGPALIDRGFAWTGGICDLATANVYSPAPDSSDIKQTASVLTHAACSMAGGSWQGGYDISGHVFILVLGSGMLWMEMLPFLAAGWRGLGVGRILTTANGNVERVGGVQDELAAASSGQAIRSVSDATHKVSSAARHEMEAHPQLQQGVQATINTAKGLKHYAAAMALVIALLSWWMLLMTAAFFHTWFEKLSGLLLASGALWTMYYLPRGSPLVREVLGMPGV